MIRLPLLWLCLATSGAVPALAGQTDMAGAFRAACVDATDSLGAVAQVWAGLTDVPVSEIDIAKHPEKPFYSIFSPLDLLSDENGDERLTLYARAASADGAINYCMISNDGTMTPDAHLAALIETLSLVPDTSAPQRPLSEAEVMLGIDARESEQLWTSPQFPGAQIKTGLTPADPSALPEDQADAGSDTEPANPLAMPVLVSPFGSVYFEISYDPDVAS